MVTKTEDTNRTLTYSGVEQLWLGVCRAARVFLQYSSKFPWTHSISISLSCFLEMPMPYSKDFLSTKGVVVYFLAVDTPSGGVLVWATGPTGGEAGGGRESLRECAEANTDCS